MAAAVMQIAASLDKLYINGEYVKSHSDKKLTLRNPKDGSMITASVPIADQTDVDLAVAAAETAFHGPWSTFSAFERSRCFLRLNDLLSERLPDILTLDSLTTGNPVSLIPTREKNYISNGLLYYAGWTDKQRGDYFPADDGFVKLVQHEPLGVCAAINPYNSPVASFIMKAAPCLATGNVLIVKPSEKGPLGSLALAPLFEEAGFPKGVVQVLSGDGSTGALLAQHMRVRKVSFTGSVNTGKKIQVAAAQSNLKRVTLELGGKSPAIVFDDANLDNALTWTVNGILARSGQVCVASSRVYVQEGIAAAFIEKYVERMKAASQSLGDPQDSSTALGPLADSQAFEKVQAMIARGKTEAQLIAGGKQKGSDGCFIEPTVFLNPVPNAEILREEVFGPVAVVMTFKTEEEIIQKANDTEYGLMAGVFTKDVNRALRVSARIDSGVVGVNCISVMNMQVPFGGKKASGLGREMGEYALRAFTEPKTVLIKHRTVTEGYVDAITGDWLSELNIAWNAIRKREDPSQGYEVGFLEQLDMSIDIIAEKKIKCVTNAGALNTAECARQAEEICRKHAHEHLKVAHVLGDDITEIVVDPAKQQELGGIVHLDHPEQTLSAWGKEPYCGVAYIGAWGIVEALRRGADIVICGRVTDASPVIGLAAWWHGWSHDAWDELAGALVAGHLIECGPYATGANFSGVRPYLDGLVDLGFPIAEIDHSGSAVITKHAVAAGFVDEMNIRAQFLYELQGTKYLNPDVCADIENIHIENTGEKDRVRVYGAVGSPPPPATKAITVAIGGYQAEATFYMNGLDLDVKERFMRQQLQYAFRNANFAELSIERHGSAMPNPPRQALGTVGYRVLVKAANKDDLREDVFRKYVYALRMQFYAGYHMSLDFRTMSPRMFMNLFPGLISHTRLPQRVVLDRVETVIHHHGVTAPPPGKRPSIETQSPTPLETFGPTELRPLGSIVHGRSGDKGDNCNVGFFVRSAEEYKWLQSYLTVAKITQLMGEDIQPETTVERCEFPKIWAVHFRFLDVLGGGAASSTRIDMLGKGVAEYLRSKFVDVPVKFPGNDISIVVP